MSFNLISAAEAASLIKHGYNIGLSGFTPAGTAKAVTAELAKIAEAEHAKGNPFQVGIFTGASTGESCDGVMARAKAIRYRAPYTTNSDFRKAVNNGEIAYNDIHLSQMAQEVRYGFMGKVNVAIIEACELTPDGKIYLTAAGGISPTICRLADQIIVELNSAHSKAGMGLHDVYEPLDPPYRREIPIYKPSDRIGLPYIQVDPKKLIGVVETNKPDEARSFAAADPLTDKIGQNVADFLAADMKRGIIPASFLPLQSGVGNIANAVLGALGRDKTIPPFEMYTEVIQNSVIGLIREGRIKFGSACSLTVTNDCLEGVYNDMDFFRDKLVLRPSEISNSPEVVRRLGIISINTAIEVDLYGNVNSTHIGGTKMMNGIGGSGDFTRNAYISIFTCPSVAKEGKISAIVPMVSHQDHSEHSVNIVITEQGVADLRGKSPKERAQAIIENCAHPDYKQLLWDYLKLAGDKAQTPHAIQAALGMHAELAKSGDMKNTDWAAYSK
ncbi:succinate CoA transferase [Bacteroides faecichinchillae]|uniref:Succinate CoA transferase n=1 Tax=Bacteroides faecichinchillae TaxID=871325 RepID=A0A1M5DFJ8_9BACE|nr:acetyl-CoA hydrolase/transferase family protein [Bacteroides faecichinchillae]THG55582.1 acetyl-CoA hydrolase/transferase family protein [Bacteroides faecichinchillae]SHF65624.1 succinate CoA transferase [Bacteroides faecichinchillae]